MTSASNQTEAVMPKPTHTIDKNRFHDAMIRRGWVYDSNHVWNIPVGNTREKSEKEWTEALLESVICPHEEAGVE
jgi:hypothetical protein